MSAFVSILARQRVARRMLSGTVRVAVIMAGFSAAAADDAPAKPQTFVYKTVGPTKIELDVYPPSGSEPRPGVVWIHGGALIMGSRHGVPGDIARLCRERNYVLVSIDYRLAPEVKLPAIIEDLRDAFAWLRTEGPQRFHLDPQKLVVCGSSAGGYLTMMSGICIDPKPRALVAFWGYGDVDGRWLTQPSDHYRNSPLVSQDDAYQTVGKSVVTGADGRPRVTYYLYVRQNGLWCQQVTGFNPRTERAKLDPYCPVRKITPNYPPILMVHGTADTDVPYQESADMDAELGRKGVEHELITVEGGGHGLGGGDKQVIAQAYERAMAFIRGHLE